MPYSSLLDFIFYSFKFALQRTVPRTDLLKQAENILNDVAGGRALLEIQYEGEVNISSL